MGRGGNSRRGGRAVRALSIPHSDACEELANTGSRFRMGSLRFVIIGIRARFYGGLPQDPIAPKSTNSTMSRGQKHGEFSLTS